VEKDIKGGLEKKKGKKKGKIGKVTALQSSGNIIEALSKKGGRF